MAAVGRYLLLAGAGFGVGRLLALAAPLPVAPAEPQAEAPVPEPASDTRGAAPRPPASPRAAMSRLSVSMTWTRALAAVPGTAVADVRCATACVVEIRGADDGLEKLLADPYGLLPAFDAFHLATDWDDGRQRLFVLPRGASAGTDPDAELAHAALEAGCAFR